MRVPAFRRGISHEDPARARERQDRFMEGLRERTAAKIARRAVSPIWDIPHVWARLLEAEQIAQRRRDSIGPAGPQTCWPHHSYDAAEQDEQQQMATTEARPTRAGRPNTVEIARQEEAMRWPARYIPHDALAASAVSHGARWAALDLDIVKMIDSAWVGDAQSFDRKKRDGLEAIARGLNRDRVAVT